MGSESIAIDPNNGIISQGLARGIIVLVKSNYLVKKISRLNIFRKLKLEINPFFPPKQYKYGRRFLLLVGYNIQPTSSTTNQIAVLMIYHQLDFTKWHLFLCKVKQNKVCAAFFGREGEGDMPRNVHNQMLAISRSVTPPLLVMWVSRLVRSGKAKVPLQTMLYKEEKTITSNPYLDIETNLNANPTVKDKRMI